MPSDDGFAPSVAGQLPGVLSGVHSGLLSGDDVGASSAQLGLPDHLEWVGPLGAGGMGEVHRVRDLRLERLVALKTVHQAHIGDVAIYDRFVTEARATAALVHPGIAPVHELGELADGRPFFTMREVHGRSLQEAWSDDDAPRPWLDVFERVCDVVAYAHGQGAVHRDLKPSNVMVGSYGEVLVVDWGLIKTPDQQEPSSQIVGTRRYMAPEQAAGGATTARSDVYALGLILAMLLRGERGPDGAAILPPSVSPFLVEVQRQACATDPADRFADAGALRAATVAARHRVQTLRDAEALVAEADDARGVELERRESANRLRREAVVELSEIPAHAPAAARHHAWSLEDDADGLEAQAQQAAARAVRLLHAALRIVDHPPAHQRLADHYRAAHERASADGHVEGPVWEQLLATHNRGRHDRYLAGEGAVSLSASPVGAEVELITLGLRNRRLQPIRREALGRGPIVDRPLAAGPYAVRFRHPGHHDVVYPFVVARDGHWTNTRPDGTPLPVRLPLASEVLPHEVFVPAGWCTIGGHAQNAHPSSRVWLDDFVIDRFPVTNRQYLRFLTRLARDVGPDAVTDLIPRAQSSQRPLFRPDRNGAFQIIADDEGETWDLDWPVLLTSGAAAWRYAAERSDRTGLTYGLPHELEWEKAARGADRRRYAWGDHGDYSWACLSGTFPGPAHPASVYDFPHDVSVYGMRGVVGNARDRCSNAFTESVSNGGCVPVRRAPAEGLHVVRGGAWSLALRHAETTIRLGVPMHHVSAVIGFRLARSLE